MSQIIFCRADCTHNINGACIQPTITVTLLGTCNKQNPHPKPKLQPKTKQQTRHQRKQPLFTPDYSPLSLGEVKP